MNQCGAAEFETDENGNKVRARRRSEPDAHRPTGMEEGQSSVGGRRPSGPVRTFKTQNSSPNAQWWGPGKVWVSERLNPSSAAKYTALTVY